MASPSIRRRSSVPFAAMNALECRMLMISPLRASAEVSQRARDPR